MSEIQEVEIQVGAEEQVNNEPMDRQDHNGQENAKQVSGKLKMKKKRGSRRGGKNTKAQTNAAVEVEVEMTDVEINGTSISVPVVASERLFQELQDIIGSGEITRSNIVGILISLMQIVEDYDGVRGVQKKALIISALMKFIDVNVKNSQDAIDLKLLVQLTVPTVIDTFIRVDTGNTTIGTRAYNRQCCVIM